MERIVKDIAPYVKVTRNHVSVHQFGLNGQYIKTFESLKEAAVAVGCNKQSLSLCINGKLKSAAGFQWKKAN